MFEKESPDHLSLLRKIAHRAMRERGLWPDFQAGELAELDTISAPELRIAGNVKDLRKLPWCSIDHNDTQSLDQLSCAEALPNATIKLLVAIADVEAVVKEQSALDAHARHNTCSVYTAVELFPMLPAKLSTDFCSLNQGGDRLAVVVELIVNADGNLQATDLYPALVHSKAKLHYNSVSNWLDGIAPIPQAVEAVKGLEANLRLQDKVAKLLHEQRHKHGALDFENMQIKPVFEHEEVKDLAVERPNRAREMVADFMIAANGVVATYLGFQNFPSFRRVVRTPKRWDRIVELAAEKGYKLYPEPNSPALNRFLSAEKASHPGHFPFLSYTISKLLGPGEYAIELPGSDQTDYFGLAAKDYTHSTAPNRRYPDLVTQRLLKAALSGASLPYAIGDLEELARHCTEVEDVVKKVERQVNKSVAAMHLQTRLGEQFDGIVTGASEKGTWVRILHPPVEGKLVSGAEGMDVGHHLRVQLVRADVENGFIDFKRVH